MKTQFFLIFLLAIFFSTVAQAEQTCRKNIEQSTPDSRYIFHDDGTLTDIKTKITWMRCALGQKWDGKTCLGNATHYDWQQAKEAVADLNSDSFGEPTLWRLPKVPELASIVERQCFQPRVNLSAFPATPAQLFWTAMEKKGDGKIAYAIDFNEGAITLSNKSGAAPVRLMLDGPGKKWWNLPKKTLSSR